MTLLCNKGSINIVYEFLSKIFIYFINQITTVAGRESPCNCLDAACSCFEIDQFLATNVLFNSISSIAVTPDSVLYIADQGNIRVRAVSSRYVYF